MNHPPVSTSPSPDSNSNDFQRARAEFKRVWGYDDFRSPQGEIVQTLLSGQDALVVMPTGGGKSICFQLPALLQTGLTLVISPLVALMENQVAELQAKQLPAAVLHSQLAKSQRQQALKHLEHGTLRLLYLSPETLFSPPVWQRLLQPTITVRGLILDEAHCLAQWGDTFRPAYRRLGSVRPALEQHQTDPLAIAAFTATADRSTQRILCRALQLRTPRQFLLDPYRPHLTLRVQCTWSPRQRWETIHRYLHQQRTPQNRTPSGLVYVRTRRDGEALAQRLRHLGHHTCAYHGGLTAGERRDIEADWMADRLPFVVSTNAFGMGVNKPNVRWVIHYQVPLLLAEYIQEVGRAGRDGQAAEAIALVSEPTGWLDPSDRQRWRFFQTQQQQQYQAALKLARQIPREGTLKAVTAQFPKGAMALGVLHSLDRLQWQDPFTYRLVDPPPSPAAPVRSAFPPRLSQPENPSQVMAHYLHSSQCRWGQLLRAFGFTPTQARCGHCDNCLGQGHPRLPGLSRLLSRSS
ncbi:MAG: RecQ family ATP-dependent DNA helicase [Prochlorothrix sp.]